jgi:transposase
MTSTIAQVSMGKRTYKKFDDALKVKIVMEALKETMPLTALASKYGVHPNQIVTWKKRFVAYSAEAFSNTSTHQREVEKLREERDRLVHQIGEQSIDIEFLKKN